ncbi:flagellar assembly protein FliW [Pseudodesulfovibrio thermohalotolerans]|uniref:flagellar assembly protein FliW n=1 Tax=Pseudodesulfovibrio thermohalotolerans TaxID=2880651 RepID=UPI0022B9D7B8|nr:flagellar assembly protein FliW [Pseudodesulfovibrio thermohalotolerans]WFS64334.1 flagellar assembly protein FliW [Pseudodesulfovibrio thermohalotolerans]
MTRLGERVISSDSILYFPRGLVGLEDKREFTLLPVREGDSPFLLLQCITDSGLGLLVADPYSFLDDYDVKIENPERKTLKVENIRQLAILVTVTIPQDKPEDTTLNLQGPIVINTETRIGLQIPQTEAGYPTHFRPIGS